MRRLVLCLALAACAGTPAPDAAPLNGSAAPGGRPVEAASSHRDAAVALPACSPDARAEKPGASLDARRRGIAAYAAGKPGEAADAFAAGLEARPGDLAAFTLRSAARVDRQAHREEMNKPAEALAQVRVPENGPPHKLLQAAPRLPAAGAVALKRTGEERHEPSLVDFRVRNGLAADAGSAPDGGDRLARLPTRIGEQEQEWTRYAGGPTIVAYGPSLLVIENGQGAIRVVDFLPLISRAFAAVLKPADPGQVDTLSLHARVSDAWIVGPLLVAQVSHDGDRRNVKPDGFLVAFDLVKDELVWITDAGVSNSGFYVTGAYAVAGFGTVTANEVARAQRAYKTVKHTDAKLSVVDLATGKVVATSAVSSRPRHVLGKGARVFSWGDDTVESFDLGHAAPIPEPQLGKLTTLDVRLPGLPVGEAAACWYTKAAVALDHRDGAAVLAVAQALPGDASVTKALVAAGDFLVERASGQKGIDLTEIDPVLVPTAAAKVRSPERRPTTPKKLAPITEDELTRPPANPPAKGERRPEPPRPTLTRGRTQKFPPLYGVKTINWAFEDEARTILGYGSRYVATVRDESLTKLLDFSSWSVRPGEALPRDHAPLAYASVFDGAVLLVTRPVGYDPKTSGAVMASVNPETGAAVWRTEPGVLARAPLVFDEYVVTAVNRGAASELVAFRRHDGRPDTKLALPDPAVDVVWDQRGAIAVTTTSEKRFATFR